MSRAGSWGLEGANPVEIHLLEFEFDVDADFPRACIGHRLHRVAAALAEIGAQELDGKGLRILRYHRLAIERAREEILVPAALVAWVCLGLGVAY